MQTDALNNPETFRLWAQHYYEPQATRHYDRAIERMLAALSPSPNREILDAGCGTGVHSVRVARAGYRVRGIDISTVALGEARCRVVNERVARRIRLQRADLTDLPFDDSSFETVFSWGVVIHIPEMDNALRELVRILQPGGRLALQLTNQRAFDHRIEAIGRWALSKRRMAMQETPFGIGEWHEGPEGRLWTLHADIPAVTRFIESLGCRCTHRFASEFTELQRRCNGLPRSVLRGLTSAWFALRLSPEHACTNVLVFEKCD